ncbi:hypothetical protein GCM10027299_21870 [Larkinella ripae]
MGVAVGLQCTVTESAPTGQLSFILDAVKRRLQIDFSDHDDLLSDLIGQGAEELESFTGITFFPKTRKVTYRSFGAMRDAATETIPYGPVIEVLQQTEGLTIENGAATGEFPAGISITYRAGHEELPADLLGILITWVREQFEIQTGTAEGNVKPSEAWKPAARRKRVFNAFT